MLDRAEEADGYDEFEDIFGEYRVDGDDYEIYAKFE